ncbi:hypothetical protein [uncultured Methanobacterium sp.]|uniref:nSTAND3 domain-containing NTPase n=1 Tax=uncultured Methanobacterium sp. TaxID=176306 RepID=UPI002AA834F7|nr:hypothetical protein [uncultured Methanobacterium sp.]
MSPITEINLENDKPDSVRVGVVQFNLNKYLTERKGLLCANDNLASEKYKNFMKCAKNRDINILCFPELSSNSDLLDELKVFSDENKMIIIAGSYYDHKRKNVCPIIIPNKEIFFSEKINLSPLEDSPYADMRPSKGEIIYVIKNSIFGSFAVLICADFLDDKIRNQIYENSIDFLFVISLNRQSDTWHIDMNRNCEKNEDGLYVLYSNSVMDEYGDGKSAIFGIMDNIHLDETLHHSVKYKFMEIMDENMLVADFDIKNKKPSRPRNIKNSPNIIPQYPYSTKAKKELMTFFNIIGLQEKRYKRIDDLFVPPKNYNEIYNKLRDDKIVFIVGDPEIGKTYTSVKLLLDSYRNDGYYPIYFKGHDLSEQIEAMTEKVDSVVKDDVVVYFEDPWGKTEFKVFDHVFRDVSDLINRISEVNARVIITSRLNIFKLIEKKKESLKDLWMHVKKLSIKLAYTEENLIEILENYLETFRPEWHENPTIVSLVKDAIADNTLKTPMSIKKLIESHEAKITEDEQIIQRVLENASQETNIAFGREIEAIFQSREYEKIVFLSFPYIAPFDTQFIKITFEKFLLFLNDKYKFDLIQANDFDYHIGWFKEEIDIYSEETLELLKFSHPSYSDGFSFALKNNPELYNKIFSNFLMELANYGSEIRLKIGNFLFENFDVFPEPKILQILLSDSDFNVRKLVSKIVFEHFDEFSEVPEEIIEKMSTDENTEVRITSGEIITENFETFPQFAENIVFKMLDDEEPIIRKLIGEIVFEHFDEFSEVPEEIIEKMSTDENTEVRITSGEIITENFETFPQFAENIITQLTEDKDLDVVKATGQKIARNYNKFKEFTENSLLSMSENVDPLVRMLSGEVITENFGIFPKFAANIMEKLSNDSDLSVRNSLGFHIKKHFINLPTSIERIVFKMLDDEEPIIRKLIGEIVFEHFDEFSEVPEEIIEKMSTDENTEVRITSGEIITENFETFPQFAENIVFKMLDDEEPIIRKLIGEIVFEHFDEFSEVPEEIIEKMSTDENTEVRITSGEIITENFETFPQFAENIITQLTEDKDLNVKKSLGKNLAKIFVQKPDLGEKYIEMLSGYEDPALELLIGDIFSLFYSKNNFLSENLLISLSESEDSDLRLSACGIIKMNYELFPQLADQLLSELSIDSVEDVSNAAERILNPKFIEDVDIGEQLENMNITNEWDENDNWDEY